MKVLTTRAMAPCTQRSLQHGADSAHIKVTANGAGQIKDGMPAAVDKVWKHFLVERFRPYIESGQYLKKVKPSK